MRKLYQKHACYSPHATGRLRQCEEFWRSYLQASAPSERAFISAAIQQGVGLDWKPGVDPDTLCHDCLRNDDILRQHPLAMATLLEELLHHKTAKPISPTALQMIHHLNLVMKGTAFRLTIELPTPRS